MFFLLLIFTAFYPKIHHFFIKVTAIVLECTLVSSITPDKEETFPLDRYIDLVPDHTETDFYETRDVERSPFGDSPSSGLEYSP